MKRLLFFVLLITTTLFVFGQNIDAIINAKEAERIEKVLSSDDMRGRRIFTPGIDKAADFIANEFKAIGLQTLNNSGDFKQEFILVSPKQTSLSCSFDNKLVEEKNVIVITCQPCSL